MQQLRKMIKDAYHDLTIVIEISMHILFIPSSFLVLLKTIKLSNVNYFMKENKLMLKLTTRIWIGKLVVGLDSEESTSRSIVAVDPFLGSMPYTTGCLLTSS